MRSADGLQVWDGQRWQSLRSRPWQITAVRVLLFVEAGVLGVMGLWLVLLFSAMGFLGAIFVGPGRAPGLLGSMGLAVGAVILVVGTLVGLLIASGVMLPRRRRALRVAIGVQTFLVVLVALSVVFTAFTPGGGPPLGPVLELAVTAVTLWLLLDPATRGAVAPAPAAVVPR
jgi:hypothetical protein